MPRYGTLPDTYDAWRTAGPPDEADDEDFPDVTDDAEPDEPYYEYDDPAHDYIYG